MLYKEQNDKLIKVVISHYQGLFFCSKGSDNRQEYLVGSVNSGSWGTVCSYYDTVSEIKEILESMVDTYVITNIIGFPIINLKPKEYQLPKYETILRDFFAAICPTTMDPLGRYEWADRMIEARQ